jgi:hypothetical protein
MIDVTLAQRADIDKSTLRSTNKHEEIKTGPAYIQRPQNVLERNKGHTN